MNTLMATTFARCDEAERVELLATLSLYFKHGGTTALAVNIESFPTHIAGLPVAVNINCHVTRHKTEVL